MEYFRRFPSDIRLEGVRGLRRRGELVDFERFVIHSLRSARLKLNKLLHVSQGLLLPIRQEVWGSNAQ